MKKLFLILIFLFITNCTLNKVIKHHGVHYLEKKQEKLKINSSNKNDIVQLLGPPSTRSSFDTDLWIYIERKTSSSRVTRLGKKVLLTNAVLVVELDSYGMLVSKKLFNKTDMKNINFEESITSMNYTQRDFLYDFLSSMREKINDPLGKKKTNRE
jgi:outer membrane protein assembly factor BamE (lipoprotein component of BamABCDE complex)